MHWLYLPYLRQDNTLDEVLDQMDLIDSRAAVIAFEYPRVEMYRNGAVLQAWAEGAPNAGALADYTSDKVAVLQGWELRGRETESIFESFEQALDRENANYGLLFPPEKEPGVALIITRHEGKAYEILDLKRKCICRPTQDLVETTRNVGEQCDVCNIGTYQRCR